ncbi:MAG: trypsin-like serine protease [Candidatus Nitrosotenuis sp.]|nr:trypsin-like serine protease [Candidatus Nitrosotenuis sp.]
MNKSNVIVSGLLCVVIILVAYSIILNPPQITPTIEEISKTTKTVVTREEA